MAVDTTVNPVALAAFILTCLGCVQTLMSILVTTWWTRYYSDGSTLYVGAWNTEVCSPDGSCVTYPGTQIVGGQEADFLSKVFASVTGLLSLCAVLSHVIYFFYRKAAVRTSAIFTVGAACVFGLLAIFIFIGFYANQSGETSMGAALYLLLVGCLFCGMAAGFTAWASVKKAGSTGGTAWD